MSIPTTDSSDDFDLWIESGFVARHYWLDLWRYRELFVILAWRDVAIRYKQTVAGVAWALLQPLVSMIVMTVVFGRIAGLPSDGDAPYAIMVFAALLPWQFFSNVLAATSQSIVGNANLVSKVYFPRLIIPASSVIVALIDLLVSTGILVLAFVWFQFWPTWRILTLPLFTLFGVFTALGPGLFFTAVTVKYRDFRFVIPFLVQFGLYLSPVGYSSAVIHEKWGETWYFLYSLNPMVGVIDGFRWAILGGNSSIHWPAFLVSVGVTLVMLTGGLIYFRKTERVFADVI